VTGVARAADSSEFWPEVKSYVPLDERTRLYLAGSYAEGKESDSESLNLGAYLDVSLLPIRRKQLRTDDWQRSRYFWTRIGYDRVLKISDAEGAQVSENRGVVSFMGKAPLPADVWLEARARADLRWIGGEYSTRYRLRLEATRVFTVGGHTVVPQASAEWLYDTRYDGWARTLYKLGPEIMVNKQFRYEVYLARQDDRRPARETLNAVGLILKYYF
jgi:hypothetical protein